jgi:hypothetical protein
LDLIHNDLMGPFPHPSIKKTRCVLTFFDDFSRYTWVYFLRKKFASQRIQSTCRDSVWEKDQNPLHRQWGEICESRCPTHFFICRYETTSHITLHYRKTK